MRGKSGSRAPGRGGVLLLWLAIAGVVVLIFWGVARSYVTSNLRHEAEADVETSLVELLAESAVAEAEARVGWLVNALDGAVAEMLRRPVLAGEGGALDLTSFVTLPQTLALLETPTYRGYTLHEFSARVVFQRQIDSVPTERRALFEFTATCSSPGLVRRVSRRLELARWAKITMTTAPRPFGNFGVFFLNATGLTDADAVNRHRDRALALCREVRQKLTAAAAGAPELTALLAESFDPDGTAPAPPPFKLPDGAALYGLSESRAPQKLHGLDLARQMGDLVDRAERAAAAFAALPAGTDPATLGASGRAALTAAIAPLGELWSFERNYAVLTPASGPEWTDLTQVTYKLREDYFQRRAHYRVEEGPGLASADAQLKALLDNRVNGVIDVQNQSPVTITGTVHGRVIVVLGPGGANVRSVNASEASTGQVTLVCASGPLRLSGTSAVSVILADPPDGRGAGLLALDADAHVRGSLIATNVPTGNWGDGDLERDDRVFSGFTDPEGKEQGLPDRFYVGMSPRTLYRRLVRP